MLRTDGTNIVHVGKHHSRQDAEGTDHNDNDSETKPAEQRFGYIIHIGPDTDIDINSRTGQVGRFDIEGP